MMSDVITKEGMVFVIGLVVGGLFMALFGQFTTPSPNLCPTQLKSCEKQLDYFAKWDVKSGDVLAKLEATYQNRTYMCQNWTEIYRIGGSQ